MHVCQLALSNHNTLSDNHCEPSNHERSPNQIDDVSTLSKRTNTNFAQQGRLKTGNWKHISQTDRQKDRQNINAKFAEKRRKLVLKKIASLDETDLRDYVGKSKILQTLAKDQGIIDSNFEFPHQDESTERMEYTDFLHIFKVDNLTTNITTEHLFSYFSRYGLVERVLIKPGINEFGQFKSFGFVVLHKKQMSLAEGEHQIEDNGKAAIVKSATKSIRTIMQKKHMAKVFIQGVPEWLETDMVEQYFADLYPVKDFRFIHDSAGNMTQDAICQFKNSKFVDLLMDAACQNKLPSMSSGVSVIDFNNKLDCADSDATSDGHNDYHDDNDNADSEQIVTLRRLASAQPPMKIRKKPPVRFNQRINSEYK